MRSIAKSFVAAIFALGFIRVIFYCQYVYYGTGVSFDAHQLESIMVHYAWRVQHGVPLYPDWKHLPYVANFYTPLDFLLIGTLGRVLGSDIDGLFIIGRMVTVASIAAGTVVSGAYLYRRYGTGAALLGMLLSLGCGPVFGSGLITRPDALAETLGLAGFFLAGSRKTSLQFVGGVLLYLAAMTKQTALVYLLAAVIGLAAESRRKLALALIASVITGLVVTVLVVTWSVEPNFARAVLGQSQLPASFRSWSRTIQTTAMGDPEFVVLIAGGSVLWIKEKEWKLVALAVSLLAAGLAASAKLGSAEHYFLGLRSVAALAVGSLLAKLSDTAFRPRAWYVITLGATVIGLLPSVWTAERYATVFRLAARVASQSPRSKALEGFYRSLCRTMEDPRGRVLTDLDFVDIHQGTRTLCGDVYGFKVMAENRLIDLDPLFRLIDSSFYDMIVCKNDMFSAGYAQQEMGFPEVVVDHIRNHYQLDGQLHGLFIYTRREALAKP